MKFILKSFLGWLFSLKILHPERLDMVGPTLIMPNHVSFLDAVFLYALLPKTVCFVVNAEIAKRPLVAFALRFCRHVKIEPRNPYGLRAIISIVKENVPVVLFPEGRISVTGGLMKMYTGAALVAWKTGARIHPVIFLGPEYSWFSRLKDKVRPVFFPEIRLFIDFPGLLVADEGMKFRQQKAVLVDKLLAIMRQAQFRARRESFAQLDFFSRLTQAARLHGLSKKIVRDTTRFVTYRQLLTGIYVLAAKFRGCLADEAVVGVLMPNSIAHVTILFALFSMGKTPAVLNFSTGTKNVLDCAVNAEVRTVLTSRTFIERAGLDDLVRQLSGSCRILYLEEVAAAVGLLDKLAGSMKVVFNSRGEGTPASRIILFTSGTEGRPKGVVLSHSAILSNIDQATSVIDYSPADRMLNALPMFHSFGLMAGTLLPLMGGIEVYLYPSPLHYRIVPELAYDINATLMLGTPTFLAGYGKMAHPYDFRSLRYVLAGGEKLTRLVRELWHEKFGIRILEGYGITETGPVLCINTPLSYRADTVGRFLPEIEWRLEPVEGIESGGNLYVKGPNLMDGYLLYGQGFQPLGDWFATGDVVSVDNEGFLTIQARLKRFAKVAGEMVNLQTLEESAAACFSEGFHAVVAVPDGRKGERIIIYTTSKTANRQLLREYLLQEGHGGLLVPSELIRLDKMPLLGSGKPDYQGLIRQYFLSAQGNSQ